MGVTVAVVRKTNLMSDDECRKLAQALNVQAQRDLKPVWGVSAEVVFTGTRAPSGSWPILMMNDSDEAGALGYHEVTDAGIPQSRVFVATDQQYGLAPSVTASHELCEMLVDPYCSQCAQTGANTFHGWETCDPCEADEFGYEINGLLMSDFILQGWFSGYGPKDFRNKIRSKLALLPGGYCSIGRAQGSRIVWDQKTAQTTSGLGHSRSETSHRARFRDDLSIWAEALERL